MGSLIQAVLGSLARASVGFGITGSTDMHRFNLINWQIAFKEGSAGLYPHQKSRNLFFLTFWVYFNNGKFQTFTEVERQAYRAGRHIPVTRSHSFQHMARLAFSIPLSFNYFAANLKHGIISFGGVLNSTPTMCLYVMEDRKTFP